MMEESESQEDQESRAGETNNRPNGVTGDEMGEALKSEDPNGTPSVSDRPENLSEVVSIPFIRVD